MAFRRTDERTWKDYNAYTRKHGADALIVSRDRWDNAQLAVSNVKAPGVDFVGSS